MPFGLVPLEAVGKALGLEMRYTTLVIDLANALLEEDFRATGRNLKSLLPQGEIETVMAFFMDEMEEKRDA